MGTIPSRTLDRPPNLKRAEDDRLVGQPFFRRAPQGALLGRRKLPSARGAAFSARRWCPREVIVDPPVEEPALAVERGRLAACRRDLPVPARSGMEQCWWRASHRSPSQLYRRSPWFGRTFSAGRPAGSRLPYACRTAAFEGRERGWQGPSGRGAPGPGPAAGPAGMTRRERFNAGLDRRKRR